MRPDRPPFILAALALALTSCRPSQTPAPSSHDNASTQSQEPQPRPLPPSARPRVPDSRPLIVCFGDSLTAGFGTDPGQSYPDFLQRDLDLRGFHYRVLNEGVSGNTTKDGVERVASIASMHPAVVIVEFGGNDGLRGLPIAASRANLDRILATLKPTGARLLLAGISLPPDYGPDYIHQFTQTYVLLASKYNLPLLPFLLQNVYGVPGMMQADRTHATAQGNQVVAQNLLPLLTPLLKK